MQKYQVGQELTNVIAILLGRIFNLYKVSMTRKYYNYYNYLLTSGVIWKHFDTLVVHVFMKELKKNPETA